jgi:hypothetical protein
VFINYQRTSQFCSSDDFQVLMKGSKLDPKFRMTRATRVDLPYVWASTKWIATHRLSDTIPYCIHNTMTMMKSCRFAFLSFLINCCAVASFTPRWEVTSLVRQQKSKNVSPHESTPWMEPQPCHCTFRHVHCILFSSKDTVRAC